MKNIVLIIVTLLTSLGFAQDEAMEKAAKLAAEKANAYVYEGNNLLRDDDFVAAEMAYRKAVSEQPESVAGMYNLGNSYIEKGSFEEALYRHEQAAKMATSKEEKHKIFHNIGNVLMKNKKCKEAVEAYKNALRNDPTDEETRYNLGLAKICAEEQQDQNQDQNKDDQNKEDQDNQDQNKDNQNQDNQDQEGDDNGDKQDEGDQDKQDGENEKDDEGKPKDEKEDQGKGDEEKKDQQQPKPQPGKLSPQQIKNLLEAMNNQEEKVQEKMNAEKKKGVKVKTEKDW